MTEEWNPTEAYQNKKVSALYDSVRFTSLTGKMGDRKEKKAFSRLLDRTPEAKTALDVPCGTGRMTEILLLRGLKVTGADVSLEMMEEAREKLKIFDDSVKFVKQDLTALEFEANSFDIVSCVRLFGHYATPARIQMLKEMARVTRKWVIVQYFYETPLTLLKRFVKRTARTYEGVVYPVTEDVIKEELLRSGLREEDRVWCRKHYSEEVFLLVSKN